jgi:hypothetical protein
MIEVIRTTGSILFVFYSQTSELRCVGLLQCRAKASEAFLMFCPDPRLFVPLLQLQYLFAIIEYFHEFREKNSWTAEENC